MVTQKTKPLAFTFVFTVCVLQNIFPLFQEKKKKKGGGGGILCIQTAKLLINFSLMSAWEVLLNPEGP